MVFDLSQENVGLQQSNDLLSNDLNAIQGKCAPLKKEENDFTINVLTLKKLFSNFIIKKKI